MNISITQEEQAADVIWHDPHTTKGLTKNKKQALSNHTIVMSQSDGKLSSNKFLRGAFESEKSKPISRSNSAVHRNNKDRIAISFQTAPESDW